METVVKIQGPLPSDIVTSLLSAVGSVYPDSTVKTDETGGYLTILVPEENRQNPQPAGGEVQYAPNDAEMEAIFTAMKDGSMNISPPDWFCDLLLNTLLATLESTGATNYLEIALPDEDGTRRVAIACRSAQQTPHELRQQAERKVERYAKKLKELGVDPESL